MLGFNDTSTLLGHFEPSPRERERIEIEEEMSERDREEKKQKQNKRYSLPATRIAGLAQL